MEGDAGRQAEDREQGNGEGNFTVTLADRDRLGVCQGAEIGASIHVDDLSATVVADIRERAVAIMGSAVADLENTIVNKLQVPIAWTKAATVASDQGLLAMIQKEKGDKDCHRIR